MRNRSATVKFFWAMALLACASYAQVGGPGTVVVGGGGSGGSGDVTGPSSSTDNAFVRFDSTTGKIIQTSNLTCSDVSGVTTTIATITPAATTGATVAGQALAITASPAVASTDTAGAAAGGSVTITAGAAARNASGNANGGDINLVTGAGIGTGTAGQVLFPLGTAGAPGISFIGDPNTGIYSTADAMEFSMGGGSKFGIDTGGVYIRAVQLIGSATAELSGFLWNVNARTQGVGAPLVHNANQTLGIDTNEGTTAVNYITLPAASAGLQLAFIVQDADGQRVTAAAGDTIRIIDKVTAAAGYVESTTIGSTIVLVAINATEWVATSVNGVYTDGTFTFDNTSLTTP